MTTVDATSAVAQQPRPPQLPADRGDRVLLTGVSWETYSRLVDDLDAVNNRTRLTYDAGNLELEMPGSLHEILSQIVGRLLEQYLQHQNIAYMPLGQTTWRRELKQKGLEADGCYYIQNVAEVERLLEIDLAVQPPPDLAIEAEITTPLLPKLPVYAGIGIPEIWHIKDDLTFRPLVLTNGTYVACDTSVAVPFFTPELVNRFLNIRVNGTHFETLQRFSREVLASL